MRKSIFFLALGSCITAGLIVTGWLFLPDLAKSRLDDAGLGEVDFRVDHWSLERLVLSDVRFGRGQEQRVDRLTVLFHPMRLLRTRSVDRVSIVGADLHFVSRHEGTPRLSGVSLAKKLDGESQSMLPAIPARTLDIKDSLARWETNKGVLRIPLTAILTQTDPGSWSLDGQIHLNFKEAHADLAMAGQLDPDGTASIEVDLSNAEGRLPALPQIQGKGKITALRDRTGSLSSAGRLELDAAGSRLVLDAQAKKSKTADSAISFVLSLKASDLDMAALGELAEFGGALTGRASAKARLEGTLPVDSQPRWRKMTANGRISLQVLAAGLDDLMANTTGRMDADLSFSGISPKARPDQLVTERRSQVEGRIDAKIDLSGTFAGDNRLAGGEAGLQGRFVYDDGELTFIVDDCISLKGNQLDLGAVKSLQPIELCAIQPSGKPLLRLDSSGTTTLAMTLPSHPVALAIGRDRNPIELSGTLPKATLSAALDKADGVSKLKLTTQGGSLKLPDHALAISDIELTLSRGKSTIATLKQAVTRSLSNPRQFPTLILAGTADGRLDGGVTFELTARGKKAPVRLTAGGKHDFATAVGEVSYELDKIRFSPNGTQPGDVFPALGRMIEGARGSMGSSGEISWVAGVPVGYSRLVLSNLGFNAQGLRVRGINTRLKRASKTVRNRFAAQEIRVDLLDLGVPLRDGLIRFHTKKAPSVRIEKIRFVLGGGTLQTEPFDLRLDRLSAEHTVVLTLDAIQLDALLELIPIDGLQGTGTLSGRVPLRIRGSQVTIENGGVNANAPGILRYRPKHKPAFFGKSSNTELLFKALNNFHYESVTVRLNGRTGADLQLSISLAGANPDLYDGHPFKLNFNVTGELDTIIRRALFAAQLAESLAKRMSTFVQ